MRATPPSCFATFTMRPSLLITLATLALTAQASWFSGSNDDNTPYTSWSTNELKAWLEVHNVPVPDTVRTQAELKSLVESNWNTASAWTYDQYASAQKAFTDLRDTTFETWDESHLRAFLLQYGVVAPKGPREHLVLLAQQKYRAYSNAASSYAASASAAASTAVYGDTPSQLSKSAASASSGVVSQASTAVHAAQTAAVRQLDASKDYIYSTWSDNEMRSWLEERGVIKTKSQHKRDELLQKMHESYAAVADPIWEAWSDSYIVSPFYSSFDLAHWIICSITGFLHTTSSSLMPKRNANISRNS